MGEIGGRRGLFPSNYVERMDGGEAEQQQEEDPTAGGEEVSKLIVHGLCSTVLELERLLKS